MSNENEEERCEKRRREGEKEENETGLLKDDVTFLFLWNHLQFFVKGEMWRVVVIFLGNKSWISLRTCLVVSRMLGWLVPDWCLMCLFPLLLWSLSFVVVSPVAWIGNLWNRSPSLSLNLVQLRRKR